MVGGGRGGRVVDRLNDNQIKDNDVKEVPPYTLGLYAGGGGGW